MKGICYIMKFKMRADDNDNDEYRVVYKVGVTTRNIEKRLSEVAISMFTAYRYIPEAEVRKFTKSNGYKLIETEMHKKYEKYNCTMDDRISGKTEFFEIDEQMEEDIIEYYCELIEKYKDMEAEVEQVEISQHLAKLLSIPATKDEQAVVIDPKIEAMLM